MPDNDTRVSTADEWRCLKQSNKDQRIAQCSEGEENVHHWGRNGPMMQLICQRGDKVNCSKLAFIYVPSPIESVVDIILQLNKWSFPFWPPDTRNCNERYFVSAALARPRSLKAYFLTPNLSLAIIFLKFVDKPADVLRVMTE